VASARRFERAEATIAFDPEKVAKPALVEAVQDAGFTAT
jgi:copper chaperone CopZ